MEVILKRSKITASIINQTGFANLIQLSSFEVLGFCIVKSVKYIVLYNGNTNELKKYMMYKNADVMLTDKLKVSVNYGGNWVSSCYTLESEQRVSEVMVILKKVKFEAERKGQFFI